MIEVLSIHWPTYFFIGWIIAAIMLLLVMWHAGNQGKTLKFGWSDILFGLLLITAWPALIVVVVLMFIAGLFS